MKKQPKNELILHPVRMRILTAMGLRSLTPGAIKKSLPDVPQATLYRHLKTLLEGDVIEVVDENLVNGSIEYTYRVRQDKVRLKPEDVENLGRDELMQAFQQYSAMLLDLFSQYIQSADMDAIGHDGMSFNVGTIYLTDAERAEFHKQIVNLMTTFADAPPSEDRSRYTLASIIIPGKDT